MTIEFHTVPFYEGADAKFCFNWGEVISATDKRFVQLLKNCGAVIEKTYNKFIGENGFDEVYVHYSAQLTRETFKYRFERLPQEDRCGFNSREDAIGTVWQ